ncbi:MAG: DUF2058 family protein [Xanthomonadaceae bacterium]|jgi:uncharacterized protein YaiL (DUF2058 family)|nr:DUF2058 family protein [Xanthomonadaceae bacterium]
MSDTLRDQLLNLGFKPAPKPKQPVRQDARKGDPEKTASGKGRTGKPVRHGAPRKPAEATGNRTRAEIDLARAYAMRARKEKEERIEAERVKQEQARLKREARAKLAEMLPSRTLNVADAEIARHFEYGGKIKRIYVTGDQLRALNAGELGVVQLNGRYLLVGVETLAEVETIFAPAVALKVDPRAPAENDPYADPRYQVPDDLIW